MSREKDWPRIDGHMSVPWVTDDLMLPALAAWNAATKGERGGEVGL